MRKNCIIITGRQSKNAYKHIEKVIRFLDSDIFLVYETDICDYTNHPNLIYSEKIINKTTRRGSVEGVNLQYQIIANGWNLMQKYEDEFKFKYENVFRIRPDIEYSIFEEFYNDTLSVDKVFLNSDFIFYGKRELIKHCFLLKDNWYKLKSKRYNSIIEEIKFEYILETLRQDNHSGSFSTNRSENWFCNKLLSIPIPSKTELTNWSKEQSIRNFRSLLEEGISNYKEAIDNGYDIRYLPPGKDSSDVFSCELAILLVILYKRIIPINSRFIVANKKLV